MLAKLHVCRDRVKNTHAYTRVRYHIQKIHVCATIVDIIFPRGGGTDITVKLRYLSSAAVLDGVYLIEGLHLHCYAH